jgi:F0F1-type ATP synthase membrane subunit b/b'
MVALNLTLLVQLGLFLIFLWVTNAIILRPTLRVLDDRDSTLEKNREETASDTKEAQSLQSRVSKELATARRGGAVEVERARHDEMASRLEAMTKRKKEAEVMVGTVRDDLQKQVDAEREQYAPLVTTLSETIAQRLRKGGTGQ